MEGTTIRPVSLLSPGKTLQTVSVKHIGEKRTNIFVNYILSLKLDGEVMEWNMKTILLIIT